METSVSMVSCHVELFSTSGNRRGIGEQWEAISIREASWEAGKRALGPGNGSGAGSFAS